MSTLLNDIDFLSQMRRGLEDKRSRRARRLLALFLGKRSPSQKQLDAYSVMCLSVDNIDYICHEMQTMAASA